MKAISVYRPDGTVLHFEEGKEWEKNKDEIVKAITAYGIDVEIDFLSGRKVAMVGMPYTYEYMPDKSEDVPF